MIRRDDWPGALHRFIEAQEGKGFAWGVQDCCTFAAGAVEAITGDDPMLEFRGVYGSAAESLAALKSVGKGSLYHTMVGKFGRAKSPALAKRGDIMMADVDGIPALLVCLGEYAAGPGENGVLYYPTLQCKRAWTI